MLQIYCTHTIAKKETKTLSKQTTVRPGYPRLDKFLPAQSARNDDIFNKRNGSSVFFKSQEQFELLFEYRVEN